MEEQSANSAYSMELYRQLVSLASSLTTSIPAAHSTLFTLTQDSPHYYEQLYTNQIGVPDGRQKKRPGDTTCKYCEKFHLSRLKDIDKDKDVQLGRSLEQVFKTFVEGQLARKNLPAICTPADVEELHMPDMKILNNATKHPVLYFEFKAIFRPFIMISERVSSDYECYSHSLTLDLSNGKKLSNQRQLVENKIGLHNTIYVYWYDLPCVKGVFWMFSKDVYRLMDSKVTYDRKLSSGDYSKSGAKRGATRKLYLPLTMMYDLYSFFVLIASRLREEP